MCHPRRLGRERAWAGRVWLGSSSAKSFLSRDSSTAPREQRSQGSVTVQLPGRPSLGDWRSDAQLRGRLETEALAACKAAAAPEGECVASRVRGGTLNTRRACRDDRTEPNASSLQGRQAQDRGESPAREGRAPVRHAVRSHRSRLPPSRCRRTAARRRTRSKPPRLRCQDGRPGGLLARSACNE